MTLSDQQQHLIKDLKNTFYLGNKYILKVCELFNVLEQYDKKNIQPASIDFTLSKHLCYCYNNNSILDPYNKEDLKFKYLEIEDSSYYTLKPHEFILGATNEFVNLLDINVELIKYNKALQLYINGKSSLARLGISVEQAGFCDPGFYGTITLELYNQSNYSIKLRPNMTICQGRFSLASGINTLYEGKYLNQKHPTPSKYYLNKKPSIYIV